MPNSIKASKEDALLLDNQLCFSLYSASRLVIRKYKPLLKALDLTYPQYLVMLVLWEKDNLSVTALGERLLLDSGTLTPLLKRLQLAGLITRERQSDDERLLSVCLTAQGLLLKERAYCVPTQVLGETSLSLEQVGQARDMLTRLMEQLK
jgi:DNA-binding MarR family transcriptional regulator